SCWFAGSDVFGRIELREMLPDDLLSRVLLQPLRAGVPGCNASLRVEHEDGVVLHALHKQPEPVVYFACVVGLSSRSHSQTFSCNCFLSGVEHTVRQRYWNLNASVFCTAS